MAFCGLSSLNLQPNPISQFLQCSGLGNFIYLNTKNSKLILQLIYQLITCTLTSAPIRSIFLQATQYFYLKIQNEEHNRTYILIISTLKLFKLLIQSIPFYQQKDIIIKVYPIFYSNCLVLFFRIIAYPSCFGPDCKR